jgi:SET domain-containing protein
MKYKIDKVDLNNIKIIASDIIPSGELINTWVTDDKTNGIRYLFQEGMGKTWYETADLGRYCNHSDTPNTTVKMFGGDLVLVSNGISPGEEITSDYNLVTKFIGYVVNTTFDK